jgi:glycosyltransferase involved in cell wall biosynthesis
MKILLINKFYYQQGGAERYFFALKSLLEAKGHTVIPFAMKDLKNDYSPWSEYFVSKVETLAPRMNWQSLKNIFRIFYSWEARFKLEKLIKETQPDVAHIHNIYHQISPSILPVLKKHKIPVVMTVHDYKLICPNYILYTKNSPCVRCQGHRYYNAVRFRCLKNSYVVSLIAALEMSFHKIFKIYEKNVDLFLCPSEFVKNQLIEFGQAPEKIQVIPLFQNIIDDKSNLGEYFLYAGRLKREKGVDLLIEAMKSLPKQKLVIAGSGPDELEWQRRVNEQSLGNIQFLGWQDQKELDELYRGCFAVIIPSRVWETFGLSALEALAYGKPVVASATGALPEIIKPGENGLLFERENLIDLKDKVSQILKDKDKAEKMGQAGREQVRQEFNPEKHYERLIKIYEKVKTI